MHRRAWDTSEPLTDSSFLQLFGTADYATWQLREQPGAERLMGLSKLDIKKLCILNKVAYGKNGLPILSEQRRIRFREFDVLPFNTSEEHAGFMFLSDSKIIIAIHGTASAFDLEEDLNCTASKTTLFKGVGYAHTGFVNYFNLIYHKVLTAIAKYDQAEIICTGHSLGGGVAILMAAALDRDLPSNKISCVTFGSPGVFDVNGAKLYNDKLRDRTLRVVEENFDPIPDIGLDGIEFGNVGLELAISVNLREAWPYKLSGYAIGIDRLPDSQFVYQALKVTPNTSSTALGWMYSTASSACSTIVSYTPGLSRLWASNSNEPQAERER